METTEKSTFPNSVKKFIRLEKARIRAASLDVKKEEEMIRSLYQKLDGGVKEVSGEQQQGKAEKAHKEKAKEGKKPVKIAKEDKEPTKKKHEAKHHKA